MILSRLVLNPMSREAAPCVRDPHRLHQIVMTAFPAVDGPARAALGVLHRLDVDAATGALVLYVQSPAEPSWDRLPAGLLASIGEDNPALRSLDPVVEALRPGLELVFRLKANVTRKVDTKSVDGRRRNGRRVPLREEAQRIAWLERKGELAGFSLRRTGSGAADVRTTIMAAQQGQRDGKRLTLEGVLFDGRMLVTDGALLRQALVRGIGPAKAFGFGLLSLAMR